MTISEMLHSRIPVQELKAYAKKVGSSYTQIITGLGAGYIAGTLGDLAGWDAVGTGFAGMTPLAYVGVADIVDRARNKGPVTPEDIARRGPGQLAFTISTLVGYAGQRLAPITSTIEQYL